MRLWDRYILPLFVGPNKKIKANISAEEDTS